MLVWAPQPNAGRKKPIFLLVVPKYGGKQSNRRREKEREKVSDYNGQYLSPEPK